MSVLCCFSLRVSREHDDAFVWFSVCFSFSFLCAPRLPPFPNVVEQDSLGHQNDCLEALGFGVGGWGVVGGLRFIAYSRSLLRVTPSARDNVKVGC